MRLRPLALRAAGALAALLLLVAAAVELGLLSGPLRASLEKRVALAGLGAQIESVELSLRRRELELRGLRVAAEDGSWRASVRRARARVPLAAVFGNPALDELELEGVALEAEAGTRASPRPRGDASLPPIGRLSLRDGELSWRDRERGIELLARGLSLDATASAAGLRGTLKAGGTVRVGVKERSLEARLSDVPWGFERGALRFGPTTAIAPEGRLGLEGRLDASAAEPQLDLKLDGDVDLARAMTGPPQLRGALRVEARVSGSAADPVAAVTLRARRIESGAWVVEDFTAQGRAVAAGLDVAAASARFLGGGLEGRGRMGWGGGASEAHFAWNEVDLGTLLESAGAATATPRPAARLSGQLDATWPAERWREAAAALRVQATGATSTQGPALDGSARGALERGAWRLDLDGLRGGGLELQGELRGRLGERIADAPVAGTLALRVADLGDQGKRQVTGSASATLQVAGTLGAPAASFRAEALDVALRDLKLPPLRLSAEGSLARAGAVVKTLALEASGLSGRGSCDVDFATGRLSGTITASVADLAALREALPSGLEPSGAASASATLAGTWRAPAAAVSLEAGAIRLAGQQFESARGRAQVDADGLVIEDVALAPRGGGRLQARGRVSRAPQPAELSLSIEDADLSGALEEHVPGLKGAALSLQAELRGPLAEPGRLSADVRVARLELNASSGALSLERPFRFTRRDAELSVEDLRLRSGTTSLEADGRLGGEAGISATLRGKLEDFTAWLPAESALKSMQGPVDATLQATGSAERPAFGAHVELPGVTLGGAAAALSADLAADAPSIDRLVGDIAVSGLRIEAEGGVLEQQGVGRVTIEHGLLQLAGFEWSGAAEGLQTGGSVRLGNGSAPAALDLRVQGPLDLRLAGALGAGIEGGGSASVDLRVQGTGAAPDLRGEIVLDGAMLRYLPKRVSLDGLSGRLVLRENRFELQQVSGSVNGGGFEASGALELRGLQPRRGRVELAARGAALDWPRGFDGEWDADVALAVEDGAATLSGEVRLASGSYDGNPRVLYTEFEEWRARPSQPSALDPLRLDLRVRTLEGVRADTLYGRLQLSADLHAGGRLAAPELLGRIEAAPGAQFFLGGRTYDVESLSLDYTKATGLVPVVRARSTTRIQADRQSYVITADFQGPLDAPETRLRSDPPLTEREIASLLTTGRTSASGASADAVGLITADLLGGVGHAFGLDAVRLESGEEEEFFSDPLLVASEEDPHSRLTLTKRLSSDLEVTLSQAVAEGGGRTTIVSYRPWRGVLARATQRDDFTYAFELRHDLTLGEKRRQPPPPPRRPERAAAQVGSVVLRAEGGPAESALRARLELVEGQRFDHRRWLLDRDRLQEALAQAGFFEARVFATREPRAGAAAPPDTKLTLSYRVLSGPRTALVFEGHEAPAELREQIERAWWHSEFDASIESEAARLTRASLLDQGHTEARVKAVTTSGGRGSEAWKRLVVRVEAGRRARALEVVFTGAERVPVERLRALVKSDEARRAAFRDSDALLRSALALARGEGLLAAKAEARASLRGEDGVLEVTLVEGPQFTVGPVSVTGAAVVSETSLREAAQLEPGAVYREADVAAARERLRKLLFARGFALAGVKLEGSIDAAKASVGISIAVSTGSRQVLQEVVVDGEVAAGARRLAEKSGLRVGEPVVADEWARARRRLFDTGMFRRVELEAEPIGAEPAAGEDQPVRARFKLEDWPGLRLRYGLQLAGERDPLAEDEPQKFKLGGIAEATRQTMFGLPIGSSLSGQAREGFLLGRGALSLPRAFGQPLRSSVFLSRERVDRPVAVLSERYTLVEDTTELTFEERVRAGRILELAASYGWTWTRLHGELAFVPVDADARIGRLRATALLDGRDVLVDPRRGYFHSTSYERGGGPGFDPEERLSFSRAFVQQFLYLPIPLGSVSASGLRWERTRGRDLLSGGRLSLGGASTVRGYPEDVAEGLVSGSPDVVENALVLNQELRFPLKGLLFGGLFVDHASLWREGEGKVLSRTGIGMGVRFRTPVGVIRLDFGYPLSGQDKKLRFYLALGQAF